MSEASEAYGIYKKAVILTEGRIDRGAFKHFNAGWNARAGKENPLAQTVIPNNVTEALRVGRRITAINRIMSENPRLTKRQATGLVDYLKPMFYSSELEEDINE